MQNLLITPHYLREEVKKSRVRLWELQKITGVHEPQLSRMLNGIQRMPEEVECKIKELLEEVKQSFVSCQ